MNTIGLEDIAFFWSRVERGEPSECWIWLGARTAAGYGQFALDGQVEYAHRLAFALCHGLADPEAVIRHSCDTPACCNPHHLASGSQADNVRDMLERGRHRANAAKGEANAAAKLCADDVLSIRALYDAGVSPSLISRRFACSPSNVVMIGKRMTWKHL